jgi:hypothetical protein
MPEVSAWFTSSYEPERRVQSLLTHPHIPRMKSRSVLTSGCTLKIKMSFQTELSSGSPARSICIIERQE